MPYVPDTLIAGLSSFSEMDGIKGALKRRKKTGRFKTLLLRKNLLGEVKKYDDKLAGVLDRFRVGYRFAIRVTRLTRCL